MAPAATAPTTRWLGNPVPSQSQAPPPTPPVQPSADRPAWQVPPASAPSAAAPAAAPPPKAGGLTQQRVWELAAEMAKW